MVMRHLLNFPFECTRIAGRDRSLEVLMRLLSTYRFLSVLIALLAISCVADSNASAQTQSSPDRNNKVQACPNDDSGLTLPPGFCATVFADDIGHARHMVVAPSGVLYVNTWSGRYYGSDKPHAGGFLVALQNKTSTEKAEVAERFGETLQSGGAGGTGPMPAMGRAQLTPDQVSASICLEPEPLGSARFRQTCRSSVTTPSS